eukprot:CAMPEP_0172637186 /NCGR_PEP_ID=MMETSP1068-20121228/207757_1 /TAXON_ID=35684 /ORGANISM="Pseudopedinella elastica, Strain CCMP716" /LENGTH=102 /DNA_ID=CAMNT_0013449777 /DNA_START=109 /DNA_END=418 /DNA_ORIENTATION=-
MNRSPPTSVEVERAVRDVFLREKSTQGLTLQAVTRALEARFVQKLQAEGQRVVAEVLEAKVLEFVEALCVEVRTVSLFFDIKGHFFAIALLFFLCFHPPVQF